MNSKNESLDSLFAETPSNKVEEKKVETNKEESSTYDLQKELEAKFDELFGSFDDNT